MIELYSIRDVSRILAVQESRLRYWMQVGFVGPTVRKGGRFYYTFCDLVAVKSAKDLLAADVTLQQARKAVEALKKQLPSETHPASKLRVCSDGHTIVTLADDIAYDPIGGQVVMAFSLATFGEHVRAIRQRFAVAGRLQAASLAAKRRAAIALREPSVATSSFMGALAGRRAMTLS